MWAALNILCQPLDLTGFRRKNIIEFVPAVVSVHIVLGLSGCLDITMTDLERSKMREPSHVTHYHQGSNSLVGV